MSKDHLQESNTLIFLEELIKLDQDVLVEGDNVGLNFKDFITRFAGSLPINPSETLVFLLSLHLNNKISFYLDDDSRQKEVLVKLKPDKLSDSSLIEFFSFMPILDRMAKEVGVLKAMPSAVVDFFLNKFYEEPCCKILKEYNLSVVELFAYLHSLGNFISFNTKTFELNLLARYMSKVSFLEFFHYVSNGSSLLINEKLWIAKPDRFSDEVSVKLTNKSLSILFPEWEIDQDPSKIKVTNDKFQEGFVLYQPEELSNIPLYYNAQNQKFKDRIDLILNNTTKDKLSVNSISMMISGYPGTGKTAFAKKLCRDLGLTLMYVEVSEVQTKFIGETEQNVHKLFTQYRKLWEKSEKPIVLLFNECDQLFGKKIQVEKSSDMYLNAIQSQLLNEMENFTGILIATCNSTDNFEEAFKRRFLFHTVFEKPDFETRKKIWLGLDGAWNNNSKMLDTISQYELTGAQIDNVLKKMSLLSTIDNSVQDQLLFDLIEEEDNIFVGNKIGF
ncbi:ATP-binding protein [Aquirufa sp. OSTEICH-129V]|uniref:ATP-binding protein n=1 Tax=Aquirufa avitistagni TaxID=3104728 RepID=A0ABW6D915_9BACT